MSRVELFKKIASGVPVLLYDIVSVFCCYIMVNSFAFAFYTLSEETFDHSIGIIGAADAPTTMFILAEVLGLVSAVTVVLFILSSVATVVLLTVSAFKKQPTRRLSLWLCVLSVLTFVLFVVIPPQSYAVSLYLWVRKIAFLRYFSDIYVVLSLAVILKNALAVIRQGKCRQEPQTEPSIEI